jgi:signal transduction histidine kinase/CheY-like chemotaxis protein
MQQAPDRTASPWREALLQSFIRWTTLLGGIVGIGVAVELVREEGIRAFRPAVVSMYGGYLVMVLLQFLPRVALPVRAGGVCLSLLVVAGSAVHLRGPGAGAVLVLAVSVVLASLFFGRPGLIVSLAASAAVVGGLGRSVKTFSPSLTALGFACACGALAVIVMFVVRRLEQAHAEAAKAVDQLKAEQGLRERTQADLARTQATLFQSQKLDAVGRLAAGVAHDFNNTLQVVLGWAHVLSTTKDLGEVREGADQIRAAAEHSGSVTRQLLTFSRPELGVPRPLELNEFLGDLVKSYRRLLPNDIAVELEADPRLSLVADPAQLSQVLLNLVLNARDAMPAGGRLRIAAWAVPPDRLPVSMAGRQSPAVQITVADSGVGMDEATRARMFEPFFTTKGARGTGLGLATVYGVIHEARGAIEVESSPGAGTGVHLYFPVAPGPGAADAARVPAAAVPPRPLPRVLLVDDEEGVRKSLALALSRAGFGVADAGDVAGARRILEREGPNIDVLVTDGIMAGEKTRDLIASYYLVRADGRVIICSGYVDEELSLRDLRGRGLEYLPKPFTPPVLIAQLLGPPPRATPTTTTTTTTNV